MRSSIGLSYLCAATVTASAGAATARGGIPLPQAAAPDAQSEADRLYAGRADLASARRAADLWRAEFAGNPKSFDLAWKLARADYWLGGHAPDAERRKFYEDGIEAGQKAIALSPDKPDGHFWVAANMGMLAESFGIRAGLKYRKPIKEGMETVLRIDPAFRQGSADRALGRWYYTVPGLLGGSNKQAEKHLTAALKYNADNTATHFFLAELYVDEGRKADARTELQKVLDAPPNPEFGPEDQDWKAKARDVLAKLR